MIFLKTPGSVGAMLGPPTCRVAARTPAHPPPLLLHLLPLVQAGCHQTSVPFLAARRPLLRLWLLATIIFHVSSTLRVLLCQLRVPTRCGPGGLQQPGYPEGKSMAIHSFMESSAPQPSGDHQTEARHTGIQWKKETHPCTHTHVMSLVWWQPQLSGEDKLGQITAHR